MLFILIVLGALGAASVASAGPVTYPDRESTYPPGVANVTHEPWHPARGEDLQVTLMLESDAAVPGSVSMIFCRVEPTYVCGIPFMIDPSDDERAWTGTLAWDERFMQDETVHVGYNLTLRHIDRDTGRVQRVAAPMGNHWVPATLPPEGGDYYFVTYRDADTVGLLPGPTPLVLLLLGCSAAALLRGSDRREALG